MTKFLEEWVQQEKGKLEPCHCMLMTRKQCPGILSGTVNNDSDDKFKCPSLKKISI